MCGLYVFLEFTLGAIRARQIHSHLLEQLALRSKRGLCTGLSRKID